MEPTAPPPPPQSPPPQGMPPPGYYPPPYPYPPKKQSLLWLWILLGLLGGVFVLGILAAIAIPAFMDYSKKAKRGEAELQLKFLQKSAYRAYAENAAFPTGSAGPTPPLGACCEGPGRKCPGNQSDWVGGVWEELDFEMYSPHYFSYSYTGTANGQSFTAVAHGDLDCDGVFAEYTLEGIVGRDGTPMFTVTKPARPD